MRSRLFATSFLLSVALVQLSTFATQEPESRAAGTSLLESASPAWAVDLVAGPDRPVFYSEQWLVDWWPLTKTEGWDDSLGYFEKQPIEQLIDLRVAKIQVPQRLGDDGCFQGTPWDHLAEKNWPDELKEEHGDFSIEELAGGAEQALHARILEMEQGGWGPLLGTLYKVEPIEWIRPDLAPADTSKPRFFFLQIYEFDLDGVVICSSRSGFWNFEAGDEVLLMGGLDTSQELIFQAGHVFPVKDGLLLPQPYPRLVPEQLPVPIYLLR